MNPDRIRLLAYLDQERERIREQWRETEPAVKAEFMQWLAEDHTESKTEVPPEWTQFATRIALFFLQSEAAGRNQS